VSRDIKGVAGQNTMENFVRLSPRPGPAVTPSIHTPLDNFRCADDASTGGTRITNRTGGG